jgi:hypothetical protein
VSAYDKQGCWERTGQEQWSRLGEEVYETIIEGDRHRFRFER